MFPPPPSLPNDVGYGQLSISTAGISAFLKHAAGVWALVAAAKDIDALKGSGPSAAGAVVARSTLASADGVYADSDSGRGVYGHSTSGQGVVGESNTGTGVSATTTNKQVPALIASNKGGQAGHFVGGLQVTENAQVTGFLSAAKLIASDDIVLLGAGDCAEEFDLAPGVSGEPGTVMIIDDLEMLRPCCAGYDSKVAGVIAGAADYRPGLILDRRPSVHERRPVALIGKVFCRVDASFGPIEPGDLLTTSPTLGHAMKASDRARAFGATIGKALRSFSSGIGLIPVLVSTR
jgi:hypothetical protein